MPDPVHGFRTAGDAMGAALQRDESTIDLSPAADLARLLRALEKVEHFVGPPLVRSIAGLHSGSDRLLVVKSHRWKAFTEVARKIRERHS